MHNCIYVFFSTVAHAKPKEFAIKKAEILWKSINGQHVLVL